MAQKGKKAQIQNNYNRVYPMPLKNSELGFWYCGHRKTWDPKKTFCLTHTEMAVKVLRQLS